jgi:cell division protein FtsB
VKLPGVKRLRSEFGITQMHASRMAVRPQARGYWRGIALTTMAVGTALLTWWLFNSGQRSAGFNRQEFMEQLAEASAKIDRLTAENTQLKAAVDGLQRQARIDQAAQKELAKSANQLQEDNSHLREEVTFFRSIMSGTKVPEGLSAQNFRIEPDALPNEYRYNVLLVQGGQRERDFIGKAQLMITLQKQKDGSTTVLTLPVDDKSAAALDINLKYYQRLEGRFKVEPGMVVKSAQLRVTEKITGQVRLTRSLSIS